jgi:hypothetical protein
LSIEKKGPNHWGKKMLSSSSLTDEERDQMSLNLGSLDLHLTEDGGNSRHNWKVKSAPVWPNITSFSEILHGDEDDGGFFNGHSPGSAGSPIWNMSEWGQPRDRESRDVDRQAMAQRCAASVTVPTVVWCGSLLPRHTAGAAFSCKVRIRKID